MVRDAEYERIQYQDMVPYTEEAFMEALGEQKDHVLFACDRLKVPAETLRNMNITFLPSMRNATQLKGIFVQLKDHQVRLKHVATDHILLAKVCELFEARHNGVKFPYYGDEWGGLAVRLAEWYVCKHQPKHLNRADYKDGKCYVCGEPVTDFEAHHVLQPMRGGDPKGDNVQPVHPDCHAWVTGLQKMGLCAAGRLSFYSELSPAETVAWENTPKPRQICDGTGDPRGRDSYGVRCIDVKNCRPAGLTSCERLPVYSPADAPEPYDPNRTEEYDYMFVERPKHILQNLVPYQGPQRYCLDAVKYMLWKGVITHDCITLGYRASHCVHPSVLDHAFKSMQAIVGEAWDAVGASNDERFSKGPASSRKKAQKTIVLSCIGTMNRGPGEEWRARRTSCREDTPGVSVMTFDIGDRRMPFCKVSRRVIDNRTAKPIGLICLQKEICAVDYIEHHMRRWNMKVFGRVVDCIIYKANNEEQARIKALAENDDPNRPASYDFKDQFIVPNCPQGKPPPPPPREPPLKPWTKADETDPAVDELANAVSLHCILRNYGVDFNTTGRIQDFLGETALVDHRMDHIQKMARVVVANEGGLVTGVAGTGKTLMLTEIIKVWRLKNPNANVVCGAYTHAAARLMPGGRTLEHWRHKYRRCIPKDTVFIIDEISMVPLSLLAVLARWQLLGTKFVLMGDFKGQELPIYDGWKIAGSIGDTVLVQQLCNSLNFGMCRNRRCSKDPEHFQFYSDLYKEVDNLSWSLDEARSRYPWNDARFDMAIVKSHWKRRRINAFKNLEDRFMPGAFEVRSVGYIQGAASQPQDMWVRPGQILVGCTSGSKKILPGIEYKVVEIDADTVTVEMMEPWKTNDETYMIIEAAANGDGPEKKAAKAEKARIDALEYNIELTYEEASRWLRLGYAYTYYSIQGRTIRDRTIILLDTNSQHFNVRNLIVGISRAPLGSQIKIPTQKQEMAFMERLPDVPDEIDKNAPEELFEADDEDIFGDE